jgi:hypothetical protein
VIFTPFRKIIKGTKTFQVSYSLPLMSKGERKIRRKKEGENVTAGV